MVSVQRIIRHLLTPTWLVRQKFPPSLLTQIERRIGEVERLHSGELRFVVEHALEVGDLLSGLTARERALEIFGLLRIWDTEHNNGVLIYVLHAEHAVEIIADRGLSRAVVQSDWDGLCRQVETHFRAGSFAAGALAAMDGVAQLLEKHSPAAPRAHNELPDQPLLL